jgi:hypothetical protein
MGCTGAALPEPVSREELGKPAALDLIKGLDNKNQFVRGTWRCGAFLTGTTGLRAAPRGVACHTCSARNMCDIQRRACSGRAQIGPGLLRIATAAGWAMPRT